MAISPFAQIAMQQGGPLEALNQGVNTGFNQIGALQSLYANGIKNRYLNESQTAQLKAANLSNQASAITNAQLPQTLRTKNTYLQGMSARMTQPTQRFAPYSNMTTGVNGVIDKVTGAVYPGGTGASGQGTQPSQSNVSQASIQQPQVMTTQPPTAGDAQPPALQAGTPMQSSESYFRNPLQYRYSPPMLTGTDPQGNVSVQSGPTATSMTSGQLQERGLAEASGLKSDLLNGLAPYAGVAGQASLQKDLATYAFQKYVKGSIDPNLVNKLSNFVAVHKLSPDLAGAVARGITGGKPAEGTMRDMVKSFYGNTASVPFDMPQEVINQGLGKYYSLFNRMGNIGVEQMAQNFKTYLPKGTTISSLGTPSVQTSGQKPILPPDTSGQRQWPIFANTSQGNANEANYYRSLAPAQRSSYKQAKGFK